MRETETHIYFFGTYLSNFYKCSFEATLYLPSEGPVDHVFHSSEQYFMANKAINFRDYEILKKILKSPDARSAKSLGRKVKNFDPVLWDAISSEIMFDACYFKFDNNKHLKNPLIDTYPKILVEASPYDKIWGVGLSDNDDRILDEKLWQGENRLGNTLMKVRNDLFHQVITNGRYDVKKAIIPSKEELETLYLVEKQSPQDISVFYGVSRPTVNSWLNNFDISKRNFAESVKIHSKNQLGLKRKIVSHDILDNYEWLYDQRINQKKSKEDIAKLAQCSTTLVNKYLKKYDIRNIRVNSIDQKLKDILNHEFFEEKYTNKGMKIREIAEELGVSRSLVHEQFGKCNIKAKPRNFYDRPFNRISKPHQEIIDFIKSNYDGEIKVNYRNLGVEFDIYIPDKNFAIEYNGLFYHSENGGKTKYYHLNKTKIAQENNIFLFHVFSDLWDDRQDVVKSIIINKLGLIKNKIYARKCEIKAVDKRDRINFFGVNHLQGEDKAEIAYGLYYENNLVACMSFGKSRFNKNFKWELVRYANILNNIVTGGFSKLLKHFRKYHQGSIVSYSDRSYSEGKIYQLNGFNLDKINVPNYKYLDSSCEKRLFKSNFRKNILAKKYNIDINETESNIIKILGFNKIWDCGTIRWVLK